MAFRNAESEKVRWPAQIHSLLLPFLLVLVSAPAFGEEVGIVSARETSLSVVRLGRSLPEPRPAGSGLHAEDLISTGEGTAEIILDDGLRIALLPETTVHLAATSAGLEVELLSGTLRVIRARPEAATLLRSGDIHLIPRAGTATVSTYPGDLRLIVAETGRHEVVSVTGERRFAEPSVAVGYDGSLSSVEGTPARWVLDKLDAFSALGPEDHARRVRAYLEIEERFFAAYDELLAFRAITDGWLEASSRDLEVPAETELEENPELRQSLEALLPVSEEFEARFFQASLDMEVISEVYDAYISDQGAYLTARLDYVRMLRVLLGRDLVASLTS